MNELSNILGFVCVAAIDILLWAMLIRAIMSIFTDDGMIFSFVYSITEPVIIPVRKLLEKFNFASAMPIDISFMITYLLLSLLSTFLSMWF